MNIQVRLLIGTLFALLTIAGFYISGFNFDERGSYAAVVYVVILFAFVAGLTCPLFDKWNRS